MKKPLFSLMILSLLSFSISCKKESSCLADLSASAPIVGAWGIIEITQIGTGERTAYPDGPGGLIFDQKVYADAFELRENGDFAVYYQSAGRFCADRIDGTWFSENDQLHLMFNGFNAEIVLPIVSLEDNFLFIQDGFDSEGVVYKMRKE